MREGPPPRSGLGWEAPDGPGCRLVSGVGIQAGVPELCSWGHTIQAVKPPNRGQGPPATLGYHTKEG